MFLCENCQRRLYVIDYVNTPSNETYRKLKCPKCQKVTYTVEMIIDSNGQTFKREWALNHRSAKAYYNKKGEINK